MSLVLIGIISLKSWNLTQKMCKSHQKKIGGGGVGNSAAWIDSQALIDNTTLLSIINRLFKLTVPDNTVSTVLSFIQTHILGQKTSFDVFQGV